MKITIKRGDVVITPSGRAGLVSHVSDKGRTTVVVPMKNSYSKQAWQHTVLKKRGTYTKSVDTEPDRPF